MLSHRCVESRPLTICAMPTCRHRHKRAHHVHDAEGLSIVHGWVINPARFETTSNRDKVVHTAAE
jgi:hypothetical protein